MASRGELGQASRGVTQRAISGITGLQGRDKNISQEAEPKPEVRRKQARLPSVGLRGKWKGRLREQAGSRRGGASGSMTHIFKL